MTAQQPIMDAQEQLTRKQILEILGREKSPRLTLRSNVKGKNRLIWSHYDIVYLDGVEQPYAKCKYCRSVMKYTGRTGTGGLMRHFCFREVRKLSKTPEPGDLEGRLPDMESFPEDHTVCTDKPSIRIELENLIRSKSPRIGYISNYKGKSGVWAQFHIITLDNIPMDFASCVHCRSVVTYMSRTGTGSMTRHKCLLALSKHKSPLYKHEKTVPAILRKRRHTQQEEDNGKVVVTVKEEQRDSEPESAVPASQDGEGNRNWFKSEPEGSCSPEPTAGSEEASRLSPASQPAMLPLSFYSSPFFTSFSEYMAENNARRSTSPSVHSADDRDSPTAKRSIGKDAEAVIKHKHLAFIKNSLSLLNITQNDSFLQFAQALVDLGAEHGKVDVRQIFDGHINLNDLLKD